VDEKWTEILLVGFLMAGLGLKVHPLQQVLEAGVVAEGVPGWTDIERDQTAVSRLIGFFQPLKGLVLLTQLCLDEGKIKRFQHHL